MCQFRHFLFKPISTVFRPCRDRESHDTCDQPGHVDVLGDIPLVGNGNYGGLEHFTARHRIEIHTSVCFIGSFFSVWLTQEAYSVARQFNLIPPVCEQAEYHFFQRDKVETQLPELYHKIGKSSQTFPAPVNVGYFLSMLCCILLGVGVVSWSPLACGIITGKYENGVPESSRASMKVQGLLVLSGSLF